MFSIPCILAAQKEGNWKSRLSREYLQQGGTASLPWADLGLTGAENLYRILLKSQARVL